VISRLRPFAVLGILILIASPLAADEGWTIDRMQVQVDVRPDGSLHFVERLDVDFRRLERHGIFRDIRYRLAYDASNVRQYGIELEAATAADGARQPVEITREGTLVRFKVGDPDRTISGRTTYRISYTVANALNGFTDHDELYWNVTGTWPVPIAATSVVVRIPEDGVQRVACFQGPAGSTETCHARFSTREAEFSTTRPLAEGEQMTVVVGFRRGIVPEPRPTVLPNPLFGSPSFDRTPGLIASSVLMLAGVLAGFGTLWWREGRDRRYVSQYYLTTSTEEEILPLFGSETSGVEFEPPGALRPAQIGLLLDERADVRDLTATIIDLAVRGYLRITELPKEGWFGARDWRFDQLKPADDKLLAYEKKVLDGLFAGAKETGEASIIASQKLSSLKKKFYTHLEGIKKALYADALQHRWFVRNPDTVRKVYFVAGAAIALCSVWLTTVVGQAWGAGLLGLPVALAGVLMMVFSGAMPRRTASGREMMRRSLGFAKYIKTAEARQQEFAERANIFAEYLPFAIVFKCVDRWAHAFRDVAIQPAAGGWYAGRGTFNASSFSSDLASFSSTVSSALTSTPGGSGRSGFSGGSSGGGGGGGGGGSW
jgi:uncharacterized membrane protein YgcG